jgi:hypothetical protein
VAWAGNVTEGGKFSSLKTAIAGARDWTSAAIKLQGLLEGDKDPGVAELAALEYMLNIDPDSDQGKRWGAFGPMFEFQGTVRPSPLDAAPDEFIDRWEQIVGELPDPIVQSRFSDLLWLRRRGRPDEYCRRAIDAYLELGLSVWGNDYSGYLALARALQLSRQLRDDERLAATIKALLKFTQIGLDSKPPGVGLMTADLLADLPAKLRPSAALTELLTGIVGRDDLDVDLTSDTCGLLAKIAASAEESTKWRRRQVEAWVKGADDSKGLIRAYRLDRALALASNFGLADLADAARTALQNISDDELDLKTISTEIKIPNEQAEQYVHQFVGDDSWQEALTRFGARRAPAGDAAQNELAVREHMQRFPIQHLATKRIMNSLNLPIAIVASQEEHFDAALREWESRSIQVWGVFAAPVLDGIKVRYGVPSRADLTSFFTSDQIPDYIAERIGRSLELWWSDQPDESAHLLLPRLEAIVRGMARSVGLVIYREPRGRDRGGVRTLGVLLSELIDFVDESWRRHLANLLTDELGYNLRNLVLHGLMPRVERVEAGLLINAACYLRLLKAQPIAKDKAAGKGKVSS